MRARAVPPDAPSTVILGAGGMLARALAAELPSARALPQAACDLTDHAAVRAAIAPGVALVLNAAADTRVDRCESEPDHLLVNDVAVGEVASRCREVGATLVHVSTDYVFDGKGTRPYREDDPVEPVNAYGRGKLGGERRALASGADVLVVRTSWVFGVGSANFVDTILRACAAGKSELRVVDDQRGRPTYARDLGRAILRLLARGASGLVHFANAGETSWYGFAREIVRRGGFAHLPVLPCTSADFPRPAARPGYSVLDTARYEALAGEPPRPWEDALDDYLKERPA